MEKYDYLKIKDNIEKGEIVPFYILKKYLNYKFENNIDVEKLINFYTINDSISYNYLKNIDAKNNYEDFLEMYNMLKFSLSEKHLQEISKNLAPKDFKKQKEFIYSEPNKMFLKIFTEIKQILKANKDKKTKRNEIFNLIVKLSKLYTDINDKFLFPTLIASENYSYNKLLFDFIYCLEQFLGKRPDKIKNNTSKEENNELEYNLNENKNLEGKNLDKNKKESKPKFKTEKYEIKNMNNQNLLNKKRQKTDGNENGNLTEYENDDEFIESFQNLIFFISQFEKVLNFIVENKNDEENIIRIEIFIWYLFFYEEERRINDTSSLKYICKILITSTINEKILDKCEIYNNNNIRINLEEWKKIKFDEKVNIKIGEDIINNVRIKFFNNKLLNLDNNDLKQAIKYDDDDYLSINGLRMKSIIFKYPEIEDKCKQYLYNLVCSDIIKEGFQSYDTRFEHSKQIYIFNGKYKREIFDEMWDNIICVPFIYKNTCSKSERSGYKIYLDSLPYDEIEDNPNIINIIYTKLNDLFHEIIHIIAVLYAANVEEYVKDDCETISLNGNQSEEIKSIINKYGNNYPNEMKTDYELSDMGDIMEIYLYGIKSRGIKLYASIYFLNILEENIKIIKVNDIREKFLELISSNEEISMIELQKYCSENKDAPQNELYEYFKTSLIYKICKKAFTNTKIITNIKYRRRRINRNNNIITNITYLRNRKPCINRRYWK